jgi:phenylpropionate dioxygenase-like ring-hydroxylating dioxygenase large terminal subunit
VAVTELARSIDDGWTLPSAWYHDRGIFREEQRNILRRSWHFVTHTGELSQPGDVFPWELGGVPIVLVVGTDGEIRGFENICRHRAYPVVTEAGSGRRSLTCHYHGWSYDLGGALRSAPKANGPLGFDVADICLPRVQVAVWGPTVWVNPSLDAPTFEEWTEGMDDLLRSRGCDVRDAVQATQWSWEIDANWKVFQDNTIECYHCPTTHPEFSRAVVQDPARQRMEVGGRYWIHHSIPFRDDIPDGPTYVADTYWYNWVFPATYLQHSGRGFDIGSIDIVDVDRLRFRHLWFAPKGTPPETIELAQKLLEHDPTIPQDVEICRLVQRSHDSGVAPAGRLLAGREALLTHFYKLIVEMMGDVE